MATAISTTPSQYNEAAIEPLVKTKRHWSNAWRTANYLYCDTLRVNAGHSMDEANLTYHYGNIVRPEVAAPGLYPRIDIVRMFCRVYITSPPTGSSHRWHGVVVSEVDHTEGNSGVKQLEIENGSNLEWEDSSNAQFIDDEVGVQKFRVYGMEWILNRQYPHKTVFYNGSSNTEMDGLTTFNAGTSKDPYHEDRNNTGNRLAGSNVFTQYSQNGVLWSAYDIIDYLLTYREKGGGPDFVIDSGAESALDWYAPHNYSVAGKTYFQIINDLINQRRGLVWWLEYNSSLDRFEINVNTYANTTITLNSGSLPANTDKIYHDGLKTEPDAKLKIGKDASPRYDEVRVYGGKLRYCCTLGFLDSNLDEGWDSSEEDDYIQGAVNVTGYGTWTIAAQKERNDAIRTEKLPNVLRRYIIARTWDGTSKDGNNGVTANPAIVPIGVTSATDNFWYDALRILPHLPFYEEFDYSSSITSPTDNSASGTTPTFRKMAVYGQMESGVYADLNKLAAYAKSEIRGANGLGWSASSRPLADQPGFYLNPTELPHCLADTGTILEDVAWEPSNKEQADLDYTKIFATVLIEGTRELYMSKGDSNNPLNGPPQMLIIRMGNAARLDYVAKNTVVDLDDDGGIITNTSGGYVRDDRDRLENIADVAYEWFSAYRRPVSIMHQQITTAYDVSAGLYRYGIGNMITIIDDETINSVITGIVWDFQRQQTTVSTEFADLDIRGLYV